MDIWGWIEEVESTLRADGKERLADLVDDISTYTCQNEHPRVDAIFPEALALAKEAKHPWLEVFIRHWHLQSRILHRREVDDWLGEAVSLVEFASRPETRDCPQSVCTTQDLVSCYAGLDGPGYSALRQEASLETLARIDPTWPCFTCISSELGEAMLDGGQPEETLEFLHRQRAAMVAANQADAETAFADDMIEPLLRLERAEEALAIATQLEDDPSHDANEAESRAIDRARIFAALGRNQDAVNALPPSDRVERTPDHYLRWAEVTTTLALAGAAENNWQLEAVMAHRQARLTSQGVRRQSIRIADLRASLAQGRGQWHTVRRCVEQIEALIPKLHQPLDAPEIVARWREAAEMFGPPAPVLTTLEEALAQLGADPEADLPLVEAAHARWPDDESFALTLASALHAVGRWTDAETTLRAFIERTGNPEAFATLTRELRNRGEGGAAITLAEEALAADPEGPLALHAHHGLAVAMRPMDPAASKLHLETLLQLKPDAHGAGLMLADLERDAGDLEGALTRLNRLVEILDPGQPDWDRMVVATMLGRWDVVRVSARRLEFELEPVEDEANTPIKWQGELCRLRFDEADGAPPFYYAMRTGPVTARVQQIASERALQHFGDEVVLDAAPLEAEPQGDPERPVWSYRVVAVLKPGGAQVYALDGFHPGDEAYSKLVEGLQAVGAACQIQSGEQYQIKDLKTGEQALGLYALVGFGQEVEAEAVDAVLSEHLGEAAQPVVWPELLDALDQTARAKAHWGIYKAHGM